MRLVAYDLKDVKNAECYLKKSDNLRLIEEFVASDMECAKIEGFTQRTAQICAASLQLSIKRYNVGGIQAISRKNEAFLIKTGK